MELSADIAMSLQVVSSVADQPPFHISEGRIGNVNRERGPIRLADDNPPPWFCHPHHFRKHMFRISHMLEHPLAAACVENAGMKGERVCIGPLMPDPGVDPRLYGSLIRLPKHVRIVVHTNDEALGPYDLCHRDGVGSGTIPMAQIVGSKGDRKSTRLNSSHVRISYAVFCF